MEKILHAYPSHKQARLLAEGRPTIWRYVAEAVTSRGWQFQIHHEDDRPGTTDLPGYHLLQNQPITAARCLNLRNAYLDPFWRIEPGNDRWHFAVAAARFDPATIPEPAATAFVQRWRQTLFGDTRVTRQGHIFMPLQGRLSERRSFQSHSPLDMIRTTLAQDAARPIIATLHPREVYSDAERSALSDLQQQNPRFRVQEGGSIDLLLSADYVVSENSGLVMQGYFAGKPAVLFADIDFHHIAGSVSALGPKAAFASTALPRPFDRYVTWFFRRNCLQAFGSLTQGRIVARLQELGWPI